MGTVLGAAVPLAGENANPLQFSVLSKSGLRSSFTESTVISLHISHLYSP
jgi:hypothetical protein